MLKRHGLKKGLSLVLVFCLILSLMPTVALAQEPTASTGTETTEGVTGTEGSSTGTGDTTGTEGGSAGTGDTTGAEGGSTGTGDTTGTEGGSTGTGDTTGTEGGSTETGDTTGAEGGSTGTGDTTGTEGGSTEGGDTTGTGTGDTTGEDSSILDEIKDVIDNILKPIPGEKTPEEIAAEEAAKKAEEEAAAQAAAEEAARLEAERLAAEQARAEELASVLDVGDKEDPRDTSDDGFYKVVHLDAGRKYFTPDEIKTLIDNAAAAGYNQLELYLSDNEGFRFALDDMEITTECDTYDLSVALSVGECLDQTEMSDLISYAKKRGVEIVPCINTPGHMGAILDAFPEFRYSGSKTSIDLTNPKAVAFALAIVEKYAAYFAGEGCDFFNIGADEYANDIGDMGFARLYGYAGENGYEDFVNYLNAAAQVVIYEGMTPRAFNDGIYYHNDTSFEVNPAIQVCYWSNGWSGYEVASAKTISEAGHQMINTHGDYYWVLGNPNAQCDAEKAKTFNYESFMGSTISNPEGAMFCIWCDDPDAEDAATVIEKSADALAAFGAKLPQDTYEGITVHPMGEDGTEISNISVTAPDLVSVTVTDVTESAELVTGSDVVAYMAYDIQPETAEGAYGDEAQVMLPVPENWKPENVRGFVQETGGSITIIEGKYQNGTYTFVMPHFSVGGVLLLETKDIQNMGRVTVSVGGTNQTQISGLLAKLGETYTVTGDGDVSVTVENSDPIGGSEGGSKTVLGAPVTSFKNGEQYVIASGNNALSYKKDQSGFPSYNTYYAFSNAGINATVGADAPDSAIWTISSSDGGYTISTEIDGRIYYVSGSTKLSTVPFVWTYSGGKFYVSQDWLWNTTYYLYYDNGWKVSESRTGSDLTVYPLEQQTITPSEPTYTATITFTGVSVGTATVLVDDQYQYTVEVTDVDLSGINQKVEFWITNQTVTAGGATSMQLNAGVDSIYSEDGALFSDVVPNKGISDGGNEVSIWKGTRLEYGHHQIKLGDDQTLNGDDFTRIRYWNGTWAILTDSGWKEVSTTDQLVAYYLQKTEITQEVTTNVVDWGQPYSEWKNGGFSPEGDDNNWFWDRYVENVSKFVFLDFAVVYEDGTQNPNSFPVDNTWFFHFDGNSASNPRRLGAITFDETEQFEIWKVTEQDGTCTGYTSARNFKPTYSGEEKVVWNEDMGGAPHIDQLLFYANRRGKLIRVYVRAKATEDSLTVRYVDRTAGNKEFYSYNISVAEGTVFDPNFGLQGENTLVNNTVVNIKGIPQDVTAKLSRLTEIGEQYRFSDYTCVQVVRSEDGKEVTLYYTFSNTKDFVVDFGLPVDITFAQLGIQDVTTGTVEGAEYGSASVTNGVLHYVPTTVLKETETLQLTVNGVTHTIYLYPATTVYYEQGFADYSGTGWTGATSYTGGGLTQAAEVAGEAKYPYGYDPAYNNASEFVAESKNVDDTATFTFTGTGVDIYAKCAPGTGVVSVKLESEYGTVKNLLVVDTAMRAGDRAAVTDAAHQAVTANSIPIVSLDSLPYANYTVTITHVKRSAKDTSVDPVYLDGFRVHGTMDNSANDVYAKDSEASPTIQELRDAVLKVQLKATSETSGVDSYKMQIEKAARGQIYTALILSGLSDVKYDAATIDAAQDLLDNGPKNELYLAPGESLLFKVGNVTGKNVQVGLKKLHGDSVTCTVNSKEHTVYSTDMFYKVEMEGDMVTITNNGTGILSVTELKVASGNY